VTCCALRRSPHRGAAVDILGPHTATERKQISRDCGSEMTNASWKGSRYRTAAAETRHDTTRHDTTRHDPPQLTALRLLEEGPTAVCCVTSCSLAKLYRHVKRTFCFQLQGGSGCRLLLAICVFGLLLDLEEGGNTFLRNVCKLVLVTVTPESA
jgi:hypothetical protein